MLLPCRLDALRLPFLALVVLAALAACSRGPAHLVARPASPPPAILIRNVHVLDVVGGSVLPDRDVLISGQFISEIGPGNSLAGPTSAEIIDGAGLTLIPGLVDMHTHLLSFVGAPTRSKPAQPVRNLESFLYCGVTTVLDTGTTDDLLFRLREDVDQGSRLGPRIYASGRTITAPGGHPLVMARSLVLPWLPEWLFNLVIAPKVAFQVGNEAEAREAVMKNERAGADFIKVVVDTLPGDAVLIDDAVLKAVVDAAHERGLRVVAHIGTTRDALVAGEAGVDALIHGVYMEEIPPADLAAIAAFRIPMAPTTVVFDNASRLGVETFEPNRLEKETQPHEILAELNDPLPDGALSPAFAAWLEHLRTVRDAWPANTARLHSAGVTLITGSDFQPGLFPGPGLHREIDLMGRAGLPTIEVLRAATINPARFLTGSEDPEFGAVAVGKHADLVLIGGNPLADLTSIHDVREVVVGGVRLKRDALDR